MKGKISVDSKVYDDLGGVEEIIATHLDEKLFAGLNEEDKYVAENILDTLTGGGGLRAFLTLDEISKQIGRDEEKVDDVLEHLIKKRIVHPPGKEDKIKGYELIHDFLSRRFFERLSPEARIIKTVIDIFRRAFREWKQYGILASRDSLEMFFEYRDKLSLGYEENSFIIENSLADGKYAYWLNEIDYKTKDRALVNILENSTSIKAKTLALEICGGYGSHFHKSCDAVPALINNCKDEDSGVRALAAKALGEIGDGRAVETLIETLKDEHSWVHLSASKALCKISDERAVEPLVEALKDEHSWVRRSAAKALGKIGDKRAVVPLIEALKIKPLKREDRWVRENVAEALGEIRDERAVVPLVEALKDGNHLFRGSVAEALGEIGDEKAVMPLAEALKIEKDMYSRTKMETALRELQAKE